MSDGFIKIRRGLEEHMLSGSIGFFEAGVYLTILIQADYRTGVWTGSAPRLAATAPRGASLRDVQRALERLAEIAFIKVFHTHGQRGNYRVLIHKYESQSPALMGKRLNAIKSTDWRNPIYEPCAVPVAETGAEDDADTDAVPVAEAAPYQEEEEEQEREEKKKPKAAPKTGALISIPPQPLADWIPLDAWAAYLKLRKEKRAKVTPEAVDLLIRKLDAWRREGQDVREILERSVMNGWTGIFPLKQEHRNGSGSAPISFDEARNQKTDAALRRVAEHYAQGPRTPGPALPAAVRRIGDADLHPGSTRH
jgi:hypothetical protein